jgi:hypothetical protein
MSTHMLLTVLSLLTLYMSDTDAPSPHSERGRHVRQGEPLTSKPTTFDLVKALKSFSSNTKSTIIVESSLNISTHHCSKPHTDRIHSEDQLNSLADHYDFEVKRINKVYILQRRYATSGDIPDITRAECQLFVNDLARLVTPFSVHLAPSAKPATNPLVQPFFALLQSDQIQRLQTAKMRVRDLPLDQQEILRRNARFVYLSKPSAIWRLTLNNLEAVPTVTFRLVPPATSNSKTIFGYSLPAVAGGPYSFISMEPPVQQSYRNSDQTQTTMSLKEVLDLVGSARQQKISAGHDFGAKRLLVFGLSPQGDNMEDVLNAVADLLGLTVVHDGGEIRLDRPPVPAVSRLEDLPAAVRAACPPSLLRAAGQAPQYSFALEPTVLNAEESRKRRWSDYQTRLKISEQRTAEMRSALQFYLKRCITTRMKELKDRSSGNKLDTAILTEYSIPFSELSPSEQNAFFLYLTLPALFSLRDSFSTDVPIFIRQLDSLYVFGDEFEQRGQKWFRIRLEAEDGPSNRVNALTIDGKVD